MKLQQGKRYVRRNGHLTKPTTVETSNHNNPFRAADLDSSLATFHMENGRMLEEQETEYDLIMTYDSLIALVLLLPEIGETLGEADDALTMLQILDRSDLAKNALARVEATREKMEDHEL
tara:strand:- start:344 stop:703 length:360 start_codon:yes stop_codon:yes gene_type:complete